MSVGEIGNPLRKFKLVFLGEQSGTMCASIRFYFIDSGFEPRLKHGRGNEGPGFQRPGLCVLFVRYTLKTSNRRLSLVYLEIIWRGDSIVAVGIRRRRLGCLRTWTRWGHLYGWLILIYIRNYTFKRHSMILKYDNISSNNAVLINLHVAYSTTPGAIVHLLIRCN